MGNGWLVSCHLEAEVDIASQMSTSSWFYLMANVNMCHHCDYSKCVKTEGYN